MSVLFVQVALYRGADVHKTVIIGLFFQDKLPRLFMAFDSFLMQSLET